MCGGGKDDRDSAVREAEVGRYLVVREACWFKDA
jgi:hypothetical protein